MEMLRAPSSRSVLTVGTLAAAIGLTQTLRALPAVGPVLSPTRIVHRFDFDERAAGNLEDVPKYWEPLRANGFPHFAYGTFDFGTGRLAPPSFHLVSEGRNVAYQYNGPETRVRANTDYRIEGYIRADRLTYARTCLSAHFIDKHGRPIPETLVRSRYVGAPGDGDGWVKVELYLAAAPRQAHSISLVAWVLQKPLWSTSVPYRRHIPRTDVRGGAWFDDITIYALPRVQITTGAPGNVMAPGDTQELRVVLADDDPTLAGLLSIRAADGALVETHPVSVTIGTSAGSVRFPVDHLPPGLYHARLDVFADDAPISSRRATFARLSRLHRRPEALARSFGVVVNPRFRSNPETELRLLQHLAVRSVKLPVWMGLAEDPPMAGQRRATDRFLQELVKSGFALTAVFRGPPSPIARSDGRIARPLIELLSGDPMAWKEHLAAVVAPNAGAFRWWQMGPDPQPVHWLPAPQEQLTLAVTQLRDAIRPFTTMPRLSVPATTAVEPPARKLPVEQIALAIGGEIQPDRFASQIDYFRKIGYQKVSTYVEPLPANQYRRLPWLADWAQRVITARHSGADTVFVPQTWSVRETVEGQITEPTEPYLVLRTIAGLLADAAPGQRLRLAESVHCLAFHDEESTILALWDPQAPPSGTQYAIQLGHADRQIDLWGHPTPLTRDDSRRQVVRLTPMPVLVPGVERWLIDLRTSFALTPGHVESGTELMRHRVEMTHSGEGPVSGHVVLDPPDSWEVSPRYFSFSLMPQRVGSHAVEVRYPHNEPVGEKVIVAKVTLSDGPYYLQIPMPVKIGVTDLEVWGQAVVAGNKLVLREVVTNRSSEVLSFRGSASVPGRERQYRPISNLRPGDTQAVEYRFSDGDALIGRNARLVLREVDDGPRTHNLELRIP